MTISVCPNTVEKDNYIPSSVNILKGIASCLEDSDFPCCTKRYFCEKPEIISYSKRKYIWTTGRKKYVHGLCSPTAKAKWKGDTVSL